MIAYKGFTKDLTARLGKGTYHFEAGKTYEEDECKCGHNGFHCAENPLCAYEYYSGDNDRYFIVKAEGDINQDGAGSRISCTRLTLMKEITLLQLAAEACKHMMKYPEREEKSKLLKENRGYCSKESGVIIVRGKNPLGSGVKGSYVFLLQEERGSRNIKCIYPFYVDGDEIKANKVYGLRGDKLCEKKNLKV